MKKRKGFTLIELLAVIVILAVIALIATPIIIGIIEDSRETAFKSSLYGVFDAADYKIVQDKNTVFPSEGIDVPSLSMNNNKFTSGTVFQDEQGMYLQNVTDGKYCGNGYKNNLEVTKGSCETDAKWFTFDKNSKTITGYDNNGPKNVVIPKSIDGVVVTTIGKNAFDYKKITSVIIPETVTKIMMAAFSDNLLEKVVIPDSVQEIGVVAFQNNKISNLVLSKNIKRLEYGAFTNNQLPEEQAFIYNRNYDGTENKTSINSYGGAKRDVVKIPDGITSIATWAFRSCNILNVEFPNSVTTISHQAFQSNRLTTVILPENLTTLSSGIFESNALTHVEFNDKITTIEDGAFEKNKLTNIIIPNTVTHIGSTAFSENKITSIVIPNNVISIGDGVFSSNELPDSQAFIYNRSSDGTEDRNYLNSYGGSKKNNIVIPSNVEIIADKSFMGVQATSITIPNSVTSIGKFAFYGNQLSNLVIPNSVVSIGDYAFRQNYLTNVTIPNNVINIGLEAFSFNRFTSIKIIGKSSSSDFTTYGTNIWGWATGYNDSNIIWNATE